MIYTGSSSLRKLVRETAWNNMVVKQVACIDYIEQSAGSIIVEQVACTNSNAIWYFKRFKMGENFFIICRSSCLVWDYFERFLLMEREVIQTFRLICNTLYPIYRNMGHKLEFMIGQLLLEINIIAGSAWY